MTISKVPNWVCAGFSITLAIASFHAAAQFAKLAHASEFWWLRGWEFLRDPGAHTLVSIGAFALACVPLVNGIVRRSHSDIALASLISAALIYIALLQTWSSRPSPIIDARHFITMGMSLIPLYISSIGVGAHVSVELSAWIRKRRAELHAR